MEISRVWEGDMKAKTFKGKYEVSIKEKGMDILMKNVVYGLPHILLI